MSTETPTIASFDKFLGNAQQGGDGRELSQSKAAEILQMIDERVATAVNAAVPAALGHIAPQINAAFEDVFRRLAALETKASKDEATNIVTVAIKAIQNSADDAIPESAEHRVYEKAFLVLEGVLDAALSSITPGAGDAGSETAQPDDPSEDVDEEDQGDRPSDSGDSRAGGSAENR